MTSKFSKLVERLLEIDDGKSKDRVSFNARFGEIHEEAAIVRRLAESALKASARTCFRIWGISRKKKKIRGTRFDPQVEFLEGATYAQYLSGAVRSSGKAAFAEGTFKGKRIVIMKIELAGAPNANGDGHAPVAQPTPATGNGWYGAATDSLNRSYALDLLDWQSLYRSLSLPIPDEASQIVDMLSRMKLLSTQGEVATITNLGALATGHDLRMFDSLDRLAIQAVIYRGIGRAEAIATRRFDTGYAASIDSACLWIRAHLEDAASGDQTKAALYPIAALREVIANAAAHQSIQLLDRNIQSDLLSNAFVLNPEYLPGAGPLVEVFSDRIEVSNIGRLDAPLPQIANDAIRSEGNPLVQLLRQYRTRPTPRSGWGAILESCDLHQAPIPLFSESEKHELKQLQFAKPVEAYTEFLAKPPEAPSTLMANKHAEEGPKRVRVTLHPSKPFKDLTPEQRLIATYWHAFNQYSHGAYLTNGSLRERFGVEESNSAQISRLIKEASQRGLVRVVDPEAAPKYKAYAPYWA